MTLGEERGIFRCVCIEPKTLFELASSNGLPKLQEQLIDLNKNTRATK